MLQISCNCKIEWLQHDIHMWITQLDSEQKLNIAIQVVKALAYMHGRDPSIIHHDIKPANIMVQF